MADTPAPTTPGMVDKLKSAGLTAIDFIVWLFSYIPKSWTPYIACVFLMLGGLWFMHAELEWKIPSWASEKADCPKAAQIAPSVAKGPTIADFEALASRVDALESSKIDSQAVPSVVAPPPKKPKRKATANVQQLGLFP